jgi:hypothetical protein
VWRNLRWAVVSTDLLSGTALDRETGSASTNARGRPFEQSVRSHGGS